MQRRRIYLARHGQVVYFRERADYVPSQVELTDLGREQAAALGRALRGVEIQRVVTSGLPRTVETARTALSEAGLGDSVEIERWPDFEEFRDTRLEHLTPDNLDDQFLAAFGASPTMADRYLEGETVGSLLTRVNAAVDRLLADDDWDTVLMVLHGGVNRAILSRAITGSPAFFGHLEQSTGCLNVIDHGPGWQVRAINTLPEDPAHSGSRSTSIEDLVVEYRAYRSWS